MSLPAVTKHLKVLEKAGLVTKTRDAQRRPCELKPEALKDVADWMEQYRAFWEESFDRLDEYLKTAYRREEESEGKEKCPQAISPTKSTSPAFTMHRSSWSGTPGPIPSKSPSGGDRGALRSPRISKDLRPGGIWHYTMHGPDGVDYPNKTVYLEVEEHKKLVYDHGGYDDRPPMFRVTVLFSSSGGKTTMDMTMTLPTAEKRQPTRKFIKRAGGNATWDRLAEYLDKETSGKERFVINRSFDGPLEVMFEMWTNPDHFSQWLPPTGFEMQFLRSDIRPGGEHVLRDDEQRRHHHVWPMRVSRRSKSRIAWSTRKQFCDEHENMSRHPMAPVWPATMLTTVELTAEGPDRTRVTVTWEPVGNVTPEELKAFVDARAGMTQGWTGSFDKLEALLAEH